MTELDAALRAVVDRGNSYARTTGSRPAVSFEAARTVPDGSGGEAVVVSFTYVDESGSPRALEYRLEADDSLLRELADGMEDADGFALIVAVNVVEDVETIGVDAAIANGTFTEPRR